MTTEDQLIQGCESLGMSLDINFLKGTVEIRTSRGKQNKHKFQSICSALDFVKQKQAQINSFRSSPITT